jgi:multiple sugar transport system ATP-binding protein
MAQVLLENVTKNYGKLEVVHGINLDIAHNEFVVLVGPSGCGKSTTLRMIAGLEDISAGDISIGGQIVNDMPPRDRNISMVFQNYALYPHMTVRENLGFSLQIAGKPPADISRAVNEAAGILSLNDYLDRKPSELSGGQRQRVAMGRAIVRHPDVFLFDEPLSNLDAKLRAQMRVEIKKLHQKIQTTIIYVTHDQVEAMTLADRIVIMRSPPMNLLPGCVTGGVLVFAQGFTVPVPQNFIDLVSEGQEIIFGFRADNMMPEEHALNMDEASPAIEMAVIVSEPLGTETLLYTDLAGQEVQAKMLKPRPVADGEVLTFHLDLAQCHLFDAKTQNTLR